MPDTSQRIQALAHNALAAELDAYEVWLPLSKRDALAAAVIAAVMPEIVAVEREACARLAETEAQHMADEDEVEMAAGMMHVTDLIRGMS